MKVVFDTNVLVVAVVFPNGTGAKALSRIVEGKDELLLSPPILNELLSVLARKFSRDAEALSRLAVFLTQLTTSVKPRRHLGILLDEADNRILECALTGGADAIVTGDKAMLRLGEFRGIRLISLRDYLSRN